jgi:hypothetical protein
MQTKKVLVIILLFEEQHLLFINNKQNVFNGNFLKLDLLYINIGN